jgi:hypothetical protein
MSPLGGMAAEAKAGALGSEPSARSPRLGALSAGALDSELSSAMPPAAAGLFKSTWRSKHAHTHSHTHNYTLLCIPESNTHTSTHSQNKPNKKEGL